MLGVSLSLSQSSRKTFKISPLILLSVDFYYFWQIVISIRKFPLTTSYLSDSRIFFFFSHLVMNGH